MTFGSILSATDPVAVAVLLNELGAPPRLKVRSSPSCKSIKGHHSDNPYALSFPFSSCSNAAISFCKIWYVDARLRRSPSQRWISLRFLHDLQNAVLFLIRDFRCWRSGELGRRLQAILPTCARRNVYRLGVWSRYRHVAIRPQSQIVR